MADSTQGNGSTDPRYGPGSTSAPDSGTGSGSTISNTGPGGSTSPPLGPGSTTSGSPGSGGSTNSDGSTASASTAAPHLKGHGEGLFNHPSTDRATASLIKYASGSAAGRVESSAHQVELSKFKAEANTAYKQGQKAYHRVREQAADSGVKLAAYSDRGRSQAQKNAPKPQAQ